MSQEQTVPAKAPTLFRNYISFIGGAIAIASLACIVLLILLELLGGGDHPYVGILTYILFPSVMVFGLALMPIGAFLERRRLPTSTANPIRFAPRLRHQSEARDWMR